MMSLSEARALLNPISEEALGEPTWWDVSQTLSHIRNVLSKANDQAKYPKTAEKSNPLSKKKIGNKGDEQNSIHPVAITKAGTYLETKQDAEESNSTKGHKGGDVEPTLDFPQAKNEQNY